MTAAGVDALALARARDPPAHLRRRRRADRRPPLLRRRRQRDEGVLLARRRRASRCSRAPAIAVAWITGSNAPSVAHRARALGVARLVQGAEDKLAPWEALRAELGLPPAACAHIGDDLPDLPDHRPLRPRRVRPARAGRGARARALRHAARRRRRRGARSVRADPRGAGRARAAARGVRRPDGSRQWIASGALIDRLVAWSPVFLLGGLAALTYWLDAQVQADTARRDGTARHDADMYIENFRAVSFDAEGSAPPVARREARRASPGRRERRLHGARRLRSPIRAGRGWRSPPTRERCRATARRSRSAATCARRATRCPTARRRGNEPTGPITLHRGDAARRPEERTGRDRRPGDGRGAAWNNSRRRDGGRQRGADDQAQVRRPRHAVARNRTQVNPVPSAAVLRRARAAARARVRARRRAPARAEKADREKPINYSADTGDVNYQTKVGSLAGNVIITQGTLTIRADRMVFRQNPDNSMIGHRVRQSGELPAEARRLRRVLRRLRAARRVRRREGIRRALRPRAAAPRPGRDPQQLHFVQLGDRDLQGRGPPGLDRRRPMRRPGPRVRGVFQPKSDTPLLPAGQGCGQGAATRARRPPRRRRRR